VASSTTRRVIRGALILLSTQPVTWAASLLLVIFVPRLLVSRALGEYQMAVSLEGVLIALLSLGVPSVLTRRIASAPGTANRDISTALTLLVGLGTLGAIVVLLLVPATGLLPISTPLLALVLVAMVLTQFQSVLHSSLTGFQRMGGYAWSNAATAVATVRRNARATPASGPPGSSSSTSAPMISPPARRATCRRSGPTTTSA